VEESHPGDMVDLYRTAAFSGGSRQRLKWLASMHCEQSKFGWTQPDSQRRRAHWLNRARYRRPLSSRSPAGNIHINGWLISGPRSIFG
jgi:hypothetical protein